MYAAVCRRCAELVNEWMRVGYVQGNMNSDNILIGGRTLDYGPFAWMETYEPFFQPFTSDSASGQYAFAAQPNAMAVNMTTLGNAVLVTIASAQMLLEHDDHQDAALREPSAAFRDEHSARLSVALRTHYRDHFFAVHRLMKARKMGLVRYCRDRDRGGGDALGDAHDHDDEAEAEAEAVDALWSELTNAMEVCRADYTIFFRELSRVTSSSSSAKALQSIAKALPENLVKAMPQHDDHDKHDDDADLPPPLKVMSSALDKYVAHLNKADAVDDAESARQEIMRLANPKFILRNWMAMMAYQEADADPTERGTTTLMELQRVLSRPYDDQLVDGDADAKWYQRTPRWAEALPGVAFLS